MKIRTFPIATSLAVLFAAFLSLIQPAHAVLVEYKGDDVAVAPWVRVGTAFTTNAIAESITFGPGAIWAQQAATDPGSQWNPDATSGFVEVNFQIDTDAAGFDTGLAIRTATRNWDVLIGVDVVSVGGAGGGTQVTTLNVATPYVLRFDYDATGMDISLDGSPLAALQDLAGSAGTGSLFYLHRYTSSVQTAAQATYFDVSWDAVPEPGTLGLLSVGSLFAFAASGRRRRSGRDKV